MRPGFGREYALTLLAGSSILGQADALWSFNIKTTVTNPCKRGGKIVKGTNVCVPDHCFYKSDSSYDASGFHSGQYSWNEQNEMDLEIYESYRENTYNRQSTSDECAVCKCENGTPESGTTCSREGYHACKRCNRGYAKVEGVQTSFCLKRRKLTECICENGKPVKDKDFCDIKNSNSDDQVHSCQKGSCYAGFHYEIDGRCIGVGIKKNLC